MRKAFVFAMMLLAGCGGGLTKENYLKINEGMQVSDAKLILGSPTSDDPPSTLAKGSMTWESGETQVIVFYDTSRRVTGKMQSGLE